MSSPSEVVGKDAEVETGSNSSNGEGGGNNSDNSALVSLGNTSFGFNFESDTGFDNKSGDNSPDEGDSDQGKLKMSQDNNGSPSSNSTKVDPINVTTATDAAATTASSSDKATEALPHPPSQPQTPTQSDKVITLSAGAAAAKLKSDLMKSPERPAAAGSHQDAAAMAVENLNQIATDSVKKTDQANEEVEERGLKRKADDENGGYNSDVESEDKKVSAGAAIKKEPTEASPAAAKAAPEATKTKKKKLDDNKREERNAREKERSFRISKQINELRTLLSSGGVIVPKGTKSSVLTEAANYIRMLQQHQYRSEIDRHQLVQQVQRIGSGALGPQAAQAVRHVAAQNGVWSLGNFGGVPPKSAMMYHQPAAESQPQPDESQSAENNSLSSAIEESDYRHVFNSCAIGMGIASMGGAFIDCNKAFCQISNYTMQEICSLTVFNLTARQDLQSAFDLISQMLSAPLDPNVTNTSCVLRGALKHRDDVGLSVKLIKGHDNVAKCFCVTLIRNPASPYDTSRPIPATISIPGTLDQGQLVPGTKGPSGLDPAPAYTTG